MNRSSIILLIASSIFLSLISYRSQGQGHSYVDLGLPSGLKWATCNIGAANPEDYGDYFAWGETEPYYTSGHSQDILCHSWRSRTNPSITGYNWDSYIWHNGDKLTKYNNESSRGTVDNKLTLDLEDDAARANWGGTWRMPTDEDFEELLSNCTSKWTAQNGVYGMRFTGSNGNSIFLPAAGGRQDTYLLGETDSAGIYWSSSLSDYPLDAWVMYFFSGVGFTNHGGRPKGFPVRPVTE